MYARKFKLRCQNWCTVIYQHVPPQRSKSRGYYHTTCSTGALTHRDQIHQKLSESVARKFCLSRFSFPGIPVQDNCSGFCGKYNTDYFNCSPRFYSSKGDGSNASEGKHVPVKDAANYDKAKTRREKVRVDARHCDEHACLGQQEQQEWLDNVKNSCESKRRESPFLTKKERFKNEFVRRLIPWEKITVSWDMFPYYLNEDTKNLLMECAMSHLKHDKFASSYGARLTSSSRRILLQSIAGTELYRERLVRALARELQVPLLVLDSAALAPHDYGQECASEDETDDENVESGEESVESEVDDDNEASNEGELTSSNEANSDDSDEEDVHVQASPEAIKNLIPFSLEEFAQRVSGEDESTSTSAQADATTSPQESKGPLKKGDRVKYIGATVHLEVDNRSLSSGQRGEVYEVNGDQVAVILDSVENNNDEGGKDEQNSWGDARPSIYWINIQDIVRDLDTQAEDWYIAVEALHEILPSLQPVIVYFPDSSEWLSRAVPNSHRKEFISKLEEMFNQLPGPIMLICGQNKVERGPPKEKERFRVVLPPLDRISQLPFSLKRLTEGLKATKTSKTNDIFKVFTNVVYIHPPKEEELLRTFFKQLEDDRKIVVSRNNLVELSKVLDEHELSCTDLLSVKTDGVILTKQKAEKVVGWAKNHYLSSCSSPFIKGDRLVVPRESLEIAISRLREQEVTSKKPSQTLKSLAKDEYETNFISAVVPPEDVGVKFDDIGALENVKRTLNELVILPMRRPELFSHGNLLRPCKGILLFGPPGTGKTLLAKALATEAGANFISITGSTLTSKWFGDAEKLTKALFSFASRLAPVIIFVDEVDSLLGARGGAFEHEATRRMRNEFMAAWDGLRSKDSQRILILGATNRPFDLDDAVIRRLPRRIYVDLPDAENRMKILRIFLSQENLDSSFEFQELANATEGYSGSDLKNLCIAAAYRPVQELLEEEKEGDTRRTASSLRALNLDDFIQAKSKVGASVAYDATSMNELRKWNEQYGEGGSRRRAPFGFGD
uniref:ATPase family AAA domain-containing protein 1 n=1 Tax=Anthurium amnicola TaxID=1678845 RepID=A0A1D1ZG64_9ARAE